MGYVGKLDEKRIAQKLREKGFSYNEILKHVSVSKDTISRWCKDIELNVYQKGLLIQKRENGQKKGSIVAAENKRRIRIQDTKIIIKKAKKEIGKLDRRDKFITGIALYIAEGDKTDGQVGFSNSDPRLIEFMMNWFRKYCKIPENKFRGAIWLHEELDEVSAKTFWSQLTKIPKEQFYKTYIAKNKENSRKIRKNIHAYGVLGINVSSSQIHRHIMGWTLALFGDKIPHTLKS